MPVAQPRMITGAKPIGGRANQLHCVGGYNPADVSPIQSNSVLSDTLDLSGFVSFQFFATIGASPVAVSLVQIDGVAAAVLATTVGTTLFTGAQTFTFGFRGSFWDDVVFGFCQLQFTESAGVSTSVTGITILGSTL